MFVAGIVRIRCYQAAAGKRRKDQERIRGYQVAAGKRRTDLAR